MRCHKNSWIYLTSTYYWWLLRPAITIRFKISNNSSTIRFDSKWKNYLHSTNAKQHRKALLEAKYYPWTAAVSWHKKKPTWPSPLSMTLKFSRALEAVEIRVRTKLNPAECSSLCVIVVTSFVPYLAMVKNPNIRSCDLDLWPWNSLVFWRLWRFMLTQKQIKTCDRNNIVVATTDSNKIF